MFFGFSSYSGLFFVVSLISLRFYIVGLLKKFFKPVSEDPVFSIKEISASIATVLYLFVAFFQGAVNAIKTKNTVVMLVTLFGLFTSYFVFISVPDYIFVFLLLNGTLLAPFIAKYMKKEQDPVVSKTE